ncbi:Crp/Fnr family transcriptional regulator [Neoasaia chiangmaiensis]|uniref:Transcriptional regulator n=1 Tax=Neoasaia chiangmaiensis TaxID=320497 RepID=A0A1U9KPD3_9PROT|nr:Crp/Fnr family transcriptional regulator [Neoasaia chiangmaiensis]AQS87662.1 hypothetical protein A0U93_06660 [Neoasaia chiangmaiensis]
MRPQDIATLASHCARCGARDRSICSAIEDEDLNHLAVHSQHIDVAAGQCFIEQDELARDFFVVTEGHAKLFTLMSDGRRQVNGFAGQGQFLGLAANERYAFSAEALTPLKLCRFSHDGMRLLTAQFPTLEQRLLSEASNELVAAQGRMLLLGRKTARERLASFLIERGAGCHQATTIELPMTRTDIADYLGLTIETVSRTLNALRRDGLIDIDHITRIHLRNRHAIAALASGEAA